MSAFFFALNIDQTPFDESIAHRMMRQLDCFGREHALLLIEKNMCMGYQGFWTTPEDEGQLQPIQEEQVIFVFYGRIDNREVLIERLGLDAEVGISDPRLMLSFIRQFGEASLADVIGPYSFVYVDLKSQAVLAARDPMGSRNLIWFKDKEHLLIASYEMALVAHPKVPYEINQAKAARSLLLLMENHTSSFIQGLNVLEPGFCLTADGVRTNSYQVIEHRFYQPDPNKRFEHFNDDDFATEFKRLLKQATERRLRARNSIGSLTSGGLDSLPITILAQQITTRNKQSLTAFQWVFDDYPEADERQYSVPCCELHGIHLEQLRCDDVWPDLDEGYHLDPVFPFSNPYIAYQSLALSAAQKTGASVLLTGIHGDLLYEHVQGVVYEHLFAGRISAAYRVFRYYWRTEPSKWRVVRNLLIHPSRAYRFYSAVRQRIRPERFPYLQDEVAAQIKSAAHPLLAESKQALRPQQWQTLFGGFAGEDIALGRTLEAHYGVERRYPMRDRELVEFMASVPSEQLYRNGVARPIVLKAFEQELPEVVSQRNAKTNFSSVISHRVRKDSASQRRYQASVDTWGEYVKECYFDEKSSENHTFNVVQWRCAHYDYWKSVCYNRTLSDLGLENHENNSKNGKQD